MKNRIAAESNRLVALGGLSFNFLSVFYQSSEREPFLPCFERIQRTDRDGGGQHTSVTMSVVQITLSDGSIPQRIGKSGENFRIPVALH